MSRSLLPLLSLVLLFACGSSETRATAPVAPALASPATLPATAAPSSAVVVEAAKVQPPALPTIPKKPLTLLATGDGWGEYSPCG